MCSGVSDMTPTIVTWQTTMAATAKRAAGFAQMRAIASFMLGRSSEWSAVRPMPPATASGSGRRRLSTIPAASRNISPDSR